ncbi:MAG: transposase [Chloroflexia bacterium]
MLALLAELWLLLQRAQQAFRQERVFRRVVALLFGELFALGRHTVTQLLRTLGAIDQGWSAWYRLFSRPRFVEAVLAGQLLVETLRHVAEPTPYVTTMDGVRIPRSGQYVAGVSWWPGWNTAPFNPGLARGQRFVEVAWLTPVEESYCRAVPLRWYPAPTQKAVPSAAKPCSEWEAGLAGWHWVRKEMDAHGRIDQWLVGLGDGSFDTQGIWRELPEQTVLVIRCARNRALYALPSAQKPRRGAPTPYGKRLPAPWQYLRKRKQLTPLTIRIRGRERRLRYRVVGPLLVEGAPDRPLFLIAVGGRGKKVGGRHPRRVYRQPVYYLVNAVRGSDGTWPLPFPAEQLLGWAWQRWECEVAHREMKSSLGIGEKQCWGPRAALRRTTDPETRRLPHYTTLWLPQRAKPHGLGVRGEGQPDRPLRFDTFGTHPGRMEVKRAGCHTGIAECWNGRGQRMELGLGTNPEGCMISPTGLGHTLLLGRFDKSRSLWYIVTCLQTWGGLGSEVS